MLSFISSSTAFFNSFLCIIFFIKLNNPPLAQICSLALRQVYLCLCLLIQSKALNKLFPISLYPLAQICSLALRQVYLCLCFLIQSKALNELLSTSLYPRYNLSIALLSIHSSSLITKPAATWL